MNKISCNIIFTNIFSCDFYRRLFRSSYFIMEVDLMRFFKFVPVIMYVISLMILVPAFSVPPAISNMEIMKKIDPAKGTKEEGSELVWFDAKDLTIEGKGWNDTEEFYNRLPAKAKGKVTENVWSLSKNTAGISLRFITDSKQIGAAWDGGGAMNHMAATGNSGLDLYEKKDGKWEYCGTGRPKTTRTVHVMAKERPGKNTEYLLYLPLYQKVTELKIGIEGGAFLSPAALRPKEKKPLVFYGTSITQGGCASRSGMCHPAILGRWFDREVINLGFSGAGKMEKEMAGLMSELDPALYIFECLPNMSPEMIKERMEPFVRVVRKAHPETPILLVESPFQTEQEDNLLLKQAYENLLKEGVKNLHIMPGEGQLAGEENGTVDGVHPTDLGFFRMAVFYKPYLEKLIGK